VEKNPRERKQVHIAKIKEMLLQNRKSKGRVHRRRSQAKCVGGELFKVTPNKPLSTSMADLNDSCGDETL